MLVTFPPDIEKKIIALAAEQRVSPASLVVSLIERGLSAEEDYDPEAGNRAVAALINRTPEQIKAAQERALREFKSEFELPPGMTAQEVWDSLKGEGLADEEDTDALSRMIAEMTNRTPEQIEATRAEVMKAIPEPLPIPAGKTVFDMLFRIRGSETEGQVHEALEHLS